MVNSPLGISPPAQDAWVASFIQQESGGLGLVALFSSVVPVRHGSNCHGAEILDFLGNSRKARANRRTQVVQFPSPGRGQGTIRVRALLNEKKPATSVAVGSPAADPQGCPGSDPGPSPAGLRPTGG